MEFKQLLMERYATKKFDGRDIGEEKLNAILDMTRYTPSAINLQPWKVKVISDKATKEKLSPLAMDQAQIKTCSHLLVFCANTDFEGNAARLVKGMKKSGVPEDEIKWMEDFMGGFIKGMTPCIQAIGSAGARVHGGIDCNLCCKIGRRGFMSDAGLQFRGLRECARTSRDAYTDIACATWLPRGQAHAEGQVLRKKS